MIRIDAAQRGETVTESIVGSAREKAERTLAHKTHFVLDERQWEAFRTALDRPAKAKPRLSRLFQEKHVAKRRS